MASTRTAAVLAACALAAPATAAARTPPREAGDLHASAHLVDAQGASVGDVWLSARSWGIEVDAALYRLPPGGLALDVGALGSCDPRHAGPPFSAAGPPLLGPEAGTFRADSTGGARFEVRLEGIGLRRGSPRLLDSDGAAILIVGPDGRRIGCGVVRQ